MAFGYGLWSIAEQFELDVNHEKLLKLALYIIGVRLMPVIPSFNASSRSTAHVEEREGIARLQAERGNGIADLCEFWEEQETGR